VRVDGRSPLTSARPTRGALVATLFALVTVALVASYSLSTDDGQEVALDTEGSARMAERRAAQAEADDDADSDGADRSDVAGADEIADGADAQGEAGGDIVGVNYQIGLGDISDGGAAVMDLQGLSSVPEEEPPAAPTTQAPTTVPTTAAPTTTAAEAESTTTVAETTETTAVDPTATSEGETTTPEETTTTAAPANPDGYVDAGHGVFVPAVLLEIRRCESTNNYQAANPRSTARGAYQFLRSSWAAYGHADRYGVSEAHNATNAQQDEAALITWQRDGTRPWNASRSCWG